MEEAPAEEAEPGPHEKFADHFSEEILVTDTSYQSPNIAIEITKHEVPEKAMVYFVADIYLADPYCLVTCFPENTLTGEALKIAEANDAVLGINGDFVGYQNNGFFVRNGTVLKAEQSTADILVMYRDGSMETHTPDDYRVEDILARDPLHVWHFGPELLDADGKAKTEFNTSPNIAVVNPRTGVGYYEPGHYCFVVVDGRQPPYSSGAEMGTFAEIFESLQCKAAYNLDGGNSVYMVFDGKFANHPSFKNKRLINDMLIIREPGIDPGQEAS